MAQMKVFVSHSREDKAFCGTLVVGLTRAGADVWYDEQNMGPGRSCDAIRWSCGSGPSSYVVLARPR